ncbi:MAG: leucyl aminopeptidase [Acidobacteria bacterium]|jgi:leucyl aminopeptidase|nr:leucyl aminopeptidase [Acidobacteriota bacterium]
MTQIGLVTEDMASYKGDALVEGVFDDLNFKGLGQAHLLAEAAKRLRFKGNAGEAFFAFDRVGAPPKHLLVVGLGKRSEYGPSEAREAAALAARRLRERYAATALFDLRVEEAGKRAEQVLAAAVEGALLCNARFQKYVTDEERRFGGLSGISLRVEKKTPALSKALGLGRALAEATAYARGLVNEPANVLTPEFMAERARELARKHGFTLKILDEAECAKLGMGAYLAVAKGSANPLRFIHLSYRPKGAKFHLALVGKGLTFDSGGLSLKSADNMGAMKSDMSGSAAVMGTMAAIGTLKPKVAVDAVMAMCENMPDGGAYRPGDILTSMSGKTIEVQNTDAEGRLTLADALCYAQKRKPDAVIDLATLTGACVVALGPDFSGAMGNDQALMDSVLAAAKDSGDNLWQLPMPKAYNKYIKSAVADVANISKIRWGGAITAGLFLQNFVDEGMPWVHLDIAGPALRDDDGVDAFGHEASGAGVRTLVHFILDKAR